MLKKLLLLFALAIPALKGHSQDSDNLTKDLKCFDRAASTALDLLLSSRSSGDYEPLAEWSEKVSSQEIVRKKFPLEGDFQYVLVLTTETDVDATAIEVSNSRGEKLEYEYKVSDLDKNEINFFYTPPFDDVYQISFRTINSHKASSCMFMAILKGEKDPDEE